jgi:hypothetical protein
MRHEYQTGERYGSDRLVAGAMAAIDPMVGGAAMYDNKNIIQNAVN